MMMTKLSGTVVGDSVSRYGWVLDHVAHAVKSLDEAIPFYTEICGFSLELRDEAPDQGVGAAFLSLGPVDLELIAPLNEKSTVHRFLEKRGAGLHHICFRVESLEGELARLSSLGVELIDRSPRPGLRNKLIAFIHPRSTQGTLVELCCKRPNVT